MKGYRISPLCDDCGKHKARWAERFDKHSEEIWFYCDRCRTVEEE